MKLDHEPKWMLLDIRYDDTPHGCEHCGTAHKRTYLVEESATGRRMHVGKTCWRRLNDSPESPAKSTPGSPSPAGRAAADGEVPGGSQVPEPLGTDHP